MLCTFSATLVAKKDIPSDRRKRLVLEELLYIIVRNHTLIKDKAPGLGLFTILMTFVYARPSLEPSRRVATTFFAIVYMFKN